MAKKKKRKAQLPFRLNILFFIVFLLFSVLILKLGVVQILNGEGYQDEIDKTIKDTTKIPVPRGRILDRNHNLVVGNKSLYAITYTPEKGTTAEERLDVAEKLAEFIDMVPEEDELSLRNKKEYWYLKHEDKVEKRVTKKEREKLDNGEAYQLVLDRITKKEVSGFTEAEKEVINIKKELDTASSLTPHVVKNEDVTPKEYARVAEHLAQLPGVNATTDWKRTHPYDETLRSIFGSITTQKKGIPKEKKDFYLARGYSLNDRVGTSGLEEQYESVLRGKKKQIQYTTNKSGVVIDSDVVVEGKRGKDVVLTIDMELQKKVDNILQDELKIAMAKGNPYLSDAYAVVLDPQTGELLAVSGQHYDKVNNEFNNKAYGTLYNAYRAGSTVKGATVLSGYESGVIEPGDRFLDAPIKIAGSKEKSSYQNESLGVVDDLTALQKSSNVYMFYIAMRIAGDFDYVRNEPLHQVGSLDDLFQEFRNYFSQFGLGVSTGVDFPFESTGYRGPNPNRSGLLLNFAIGQYDTYTTMQLAQYVSTIANDGYRVRPRFLKTIRKPTPYEDELGPVSRSQNTDVLNRLTMDENLIERIQEGFRRVYQVPGGTAYQYFADKGYTSAGKTGTAEALYQVTDEEGNPTGEYHATSNLNLVGYAPYDNPEVAFAVVVPDTDGGYHLNDEIGARILDAYFNLKEKDSEDKKE